MTQLPNSDSELFRAAVALEPEQRAAFLDRECGDNRRLRDEVESLLRAHDPNDSFLQAPVVAVTTAQPPSAPRRESPPLAEPSGTAEKSSSRFQSCNDGRWP